METIPQDVHATNGATTLTFTHALAQAETQALTTLEPSLHGRLSEAVALVRHGKVLQADDGHAWLVESRSHPGEHHQVNGACPCALHKQHDTK